MVAVRLVPAPWIGERVAVLSQQLSDLGVEIFDALVEVVDVARELANATRSDPFGQAFAKANALELLEFADAITADHAGFGDRVELRPV